MALRQLLAVVAVLGLVSIATGEHLLIGLLPTQSFVAQLVACWHTAVAASSSSTIAAARAAALALRSCVLCAVSQQPLQAEHLNSRATTAVMHNNIIVTKLFAMHTATNLCQHLHTCHVCGTCCSRPRM
jgi:hypothetical protein